VAIEDVAVGDPVLAEDPETGKQGAFEVVATTNRPTDEVLSVYNFTVTGPHIYFVLEAGVLVHNPCSQGSFRAAAADNVLEREVKPPIENVFR
jgi:hypothetical protein